jgi:hypothetical protein
MADVVCERMQRVKIRRVERSVFASGWGPTVLGLVRQCALESAAVMQARTYTERSSSRCLLSMIPREARLPVVSVTGTGQERC